MSQYAKSTSVPAEQTRAQIEKLLKKYGASKFAYCSDEQRGIEIILFEASFRNIRFEVKLPTLDQQEIRFTAGKKRRSDTDAERVRQQAVRQRWRALLLVIQAKLEAVASGITCFEDEFLAHMVLPNNETVGQMMRPQIKQAYDTGLMPPGIAGLLPE